MCIQTRTKQKAAIHQAKHNKSEINKSHLKFNCVYQFLPLVFGDSDRTGNSITSWFPVEQKKTKPQCTAKLIVEEWTSPSPSRRLWLQEKHV
ncbi:hypothetical protein NDU88_001602 [Pleurodeles waltl]|uniref:Uncharacterized protein n=1 Tax=Pleurodeles waltl TaxID=8319 RepID=A0AAV7TI62_PLEWA|nr:hypothetical protein NDU88_001602 [Pleurodeles waltl]